VDAIDTTRFSHTAADRSADLLPAVPFLRWNVLLIE
jgi:hypothetical protein